MDEKIKRQLLELGLDAGEPPSSDQWRHFLSQLDVVDGRQDETPPNHIPRQGKKSELETKLRDAVLLNRVIAAATSASDTNTILHIICTELAHALGLPQVACAVLNDAKTHLTVVAEYRESGRITAMGALIPVANNPATQYVLEHQIPLVVLDAQNDPRLATRNLSRERGTVSMMLLPLINRDRVIGTIGLNSPVRREFDHDEIVLAQSVAAAAGQALENALLYEAVQHELNERKKTEEILRRQNAYMDSLYETTLGLVNRLDTTSLLEAIIARAGDLMGTEHGYLYVASDDRKEIYLRAGIGYFRKQIGARLEPGEGLSGVAWQTGQTVRVDDYEMWLGRQSRHGRFYGAVSVPLRSGNELTGVIGLAHAQRGRTFSDDEIKVLERFANLAALALENARLYSAAQQEIQERQRTEKELQKAKEAAESASQTKSTFLASVSHELRTPLNAILGYSEMLREDALQNGNTGLAHDLHKIYGAGGILLDIISDILDISKIEAGEARLFLETFSVAELINDALEIIQPLITKNRNKLAVQCAADIGHMYTDVTKVRQSLSNLLSNAAKFTEEGEIILSVWRERAADRDLLYFQVSDTGIGIEPEKLELIFEPFTQADNTTTRRFGGTGLGLAISRRFCQMMGGDIAVESQVNAGSTFTMHLPAMVSSR